MARITNYSTLQTALGVYLKSTFIPTNYFDYLLAEAEEEMNARLRVRRMMTSVTPTVSSSGAVTLPSDFRGWKRFQARDGTIEWDLDLVAAELTTDISALYNTVGRPQALVTIGSTSQIWPYQDATYTFAGLYFAMIPQLTSGAATNWVITNYPNAYLYGCLAAARGLASDDTPAGGSRFDLWAKLFQHAVDRIEADDKKETDARTNATLSPDTPLFSGGGVYNVLTDSYN